MVIEDGSELAVRLWRSAYTPVSSVLAYPEGRAALAAACRSGRLKDAVYSRTLADFEALCKELVVLGVGKELARAAGYSADSFSLRGYDAVHLATALDLGEEEVVVVTWDQDLTRAANSAGLAVAGASGW